MALPKLWGPDLLWGPQDSLLRERDVRMLSVNDDDLAPYTFKVYQNGEWVDLFARLDDAGKVPNAALALLDDTGKVPSASLPSNVALLDGGGKLPSRNLPATVPTLGEDGKLATDALPPTVVRTGQGGRLSASLLPLSIVPLFDTSKAVLAGDTANATTTLQPIGLSLPVTAGKQARFVAHLKYAAEDGCGAQFSLNGPPVQELAFWTRLPTPSGQDVQHSVNYGEPVRATSGSFASNYGVIEGMVLPSADGLLYVTFATGTSKKGITVRAGSYLYTEQFFAAV